MPSWLRDGPIQSLLGGRRDRSPIGQGALTGARMGSMAGPIGAGVGAAVGALGGWLSSRGGVDPLANPGNDRMSAGLDRSIWDSSVNLPDPQSGAERMGPPASLAGSDGSAAPWYGDTTMGADDPLGLVPDYGQDGGPRDENGDGHITPTERRDGTMSQFRGEVSNFNIGGSPLIIGSGDPNARYRARVRDY